MLQELVLCLRILLLPDRCSGIFRGPDVHPSIVLAPQLRSGISRRPDSCPDMMFGSYIFSGIVHGPHLCGCVFLRRPGLKQLQQGFGWRLMDFGLTPIGRLKAASNFVACRFLGRPDLELPQQDFGWRTDFGLTLIGRL
jgi:hypothetical protein